MTEQLEQIVLHIGALLEYPLRYYFWALVPLFMLYMLAHDIRIKISPRRDNIKKEVDLISPIKELFFVIMLFALSIYFDFTVIEECMDLECSFFESIDNVVPVTQFLDPGFLFIIRQVFFFFLIFGVAIITDYLSPKKKEDTRANYY